MKSVTKIGKSLPTNRDFLCYELKPLAIFALEKVDRITNKTGTSMKKIVLTSLMMVCLPYWAMSQSVDDDLYFIPKKKAEKKEEVKQEVKVVVPQKQNTTTVYAAPGSTVVVKDVKGKVRDVDEYNRRYTSRDNNFSMENDTLYIEEKPLNERGEWVNGFEGSQDDYEYAMRIVRSIGMWFTVCLHGIGMYMMTDCMHTFFPLTRTACGGIGVGIIHMAPAGDSVGDGVRRGTTIAGTIPVIGVAATGVAIGATIITITIIIRITSVTVGVVATGEVVMDGMAQADVTRGYMPEDIPIAIVLHAQAGIIT